MTFSSVYCPVVSGLQPGGDHPWLWLLGRGVGAGVWLVGGRGGWGGQRVALVLFGSRTPLPDPPLEQGKNVLVGYSRTVGQGGTQEDNIEKERKQMELSHTPDTLQSRVGGLLPFRLFLRT